MSFDKPRPPVAIDEVLEDPSCGGGGVPIEGATLRRHWHWHWHWHWVCS